MKFSKILVVCTGNICRSPVGAALLCSRCNLFVESAGLNAVVNANVEPQALALVKEKSGLDISDHRARQINLSMIKSADLILTMTARQRYEVAQIMPAATGKTVLFGRWLGSAQGEEIIDPFRKSLAVFATVHNQLVRAADTWCNKLSEPLSR